MTLKFAWAITGAGDFMLESVEVMKKIVQEYECQVLVFTSKAGYRVIKWYKLENALESITSKVQVEVDANTPFVVSALQKRVYRFLAVMPATANTVAKLAYGIADTLITNAVAQAMKTNVPIYIYPVDQKPGTMTTVLPGGEKLALETRQVDLDNVERIRAMKGIIVLDHPSDLRKYISKYIKK